MSVKRINKQLACMEDLAIGVGKVSQERAGDTHVLGKIKVPYALETLEELALLDPAKFPFAEFKGTVYAYKASVTTGLYSSLGSGTWVIDQALASLVGMGAGPSESQEAVGAFYSEVTSRGSIGYIPKGLYKSNGIDYEVTSDSLWLDKNSGLGVNALLQARKAPVLITVGTPDSSPIVPEGSRSGIDITAVGRGSQHIDCVRGNLINRSDDGRGNTAFYGAAVAHDNALWSAAVHGETKHGGGTTIALSSESASYSTAGSFYGAVINNTSGNAALTHPTTGQEITTHPQATALYITGTAERGEAGQWVRGIRFSAGSMRSIGTILRDESSAGTGYWSLPTSEKAIADIRLQGTTPTGIIIQGTYSSGNGVRLDSNTAVAWDSTGVIKTGYYTNSGRWQVKGPLGVEHFGVDTSGAGLYIKGKKVLSERRAAVTNADASNLVETVNAILAALREHGLIEM